jgi:acetyl esterase/lipase
LINLESDFLSRFFYTNYKRDYTMKQSLKVILLSIIIFSSNVILISQETEYETIQNVQYYSESEASGDKYIVERCVLDIYYPKKTENFATIIWFHGGGLTSGNKFIPNELKNKGVGVVAVNYRLYPKIKAPTYIEDAAAAVAWVMKNINRFGGDSSLIFISGHSAGGYLASMVGIDKRWLEKHDVDANNIAGLIPFSGHTITHFTVRKERGIPGEQPIIDDLAPLYHVRADAPPLLLITGDRELEMLGRYEENAYMMRMMKVAGHKETRLLELDGYGHGMAEPAYPLLLNEVKRIVKQRESE